MANNDESWIVIRISRRVAYLVATVLREASIWPHYRASKETNPKKAAELRQEGNDLHEAGKEIERQLAERVKPND